MINLTLLWLDQRMEQYQLNITKAWSRKVRSNLLLVGRYHYLFHNTSGYRVAPIDGIEFLTNASLTKDFSNLVLQIGDQVNLSFEHPYSKLISFGPIVVFLGARYSNIPRVKIKINPSEGGLTVQQVYDWVLFICGTIKGVWVKRVHFKLDINGLSSNDCIQKLHGKGFRKVYDKYEGETIYLGSRRSARQLVSYDKAQEEGSEGLFTRIEMRLQITTDKQKEIKQFFENIRRLMPFDNTWLVQASDAEINKILQPYGKIVNDTPIVLVLKSMQSYYRNKVLRIFEDKGYLLPLEDVFLQELNKWLLMI